jgi:hypothetical protein
LAIVDPGVAVDDDFFGHGSKWLLAVVLVVVVVLAVKTEQVGLWMDR